MKPAAPKRRLFSPRKGRFMRRAGIAALALGTAIGSHGAARAQEARADSAKARQDSTQVRADTSKARFVPSAADWRKPLGSGFNATTFLVNERVPVFLDLSRARGSSKLWLLSLTGKKNVGMHFIFERELAAKDVPDFFNFGLKGKVGPVTAGVSASAQKGSRPDYEVGVRHDVGSLSLGARKTLKPGSPVLVSINAFKEIGGARLTAFFSSNASRELSPFGGISFDQGTRAFDVSFGPKNEKAVAVIQSIGENHYVSFIYSHGNEKRFTLELFKLF